MKTQMIKVSESQSVEDIINKLESLGYVRDKDDSELNLSFAPDYICTYATQGTYTIHRHLAVGYGGRELVSLESLA